MSCESQSVIEAMGAREAIGRAVMLLEAKHNISESDAFEMLVRGSSDSHEAVREIAVGVVLQLGGA